MNTKKIKQLERSIVQLKQELKRLESSFLISFSMKKACEIKETKSDIRILELKLNHAKSIKGNQDYSRELILSKWYSQTIQSK